MGRSDVHATPGRDVQGFDRAPVPLTSGDRSTRAAEAATVMRLDCSLCCNGFVLEMAEWNRPPEEMEVLGREYYGFREDEVLCPLCLDKVRLTGAERIYWRLAHR